MKKSIFILVVLIFVTNTFAQNNRVPLKATLTEYVPITREQKVEYLDSVRYVDSIRMIYPKLIRQSYQKRHVYIDSVHIQFPFVNSRYFFGEANKLSDAINAFDKTAMKEDKEIATSMNEYYFLSFVSDQNGKLIAKYAYQERPREIKLIQSYYVSMDGGFEFEAFEFGADIKTMQKYFHIVVLTNYSDLIVEKNGEIILKAKYENGTFTFCEGTKLSEWLMPLEK